MAAPKNTPPTDEAEQVRATLIADQQNRRQRGAKVPMPNGVRMTYQPAVEPRYQGLNATSMLGDPKQILKTPKGDAKYVWKKRLDRQTSAWVRSGILRPVSMEEIDTSNPQAELFEDVLPSGDSVVTYESLALFEMAGKWAAKIYGAPEEQAIQRVSQQGAEFTDKILQETAGAYAGSFKVTGK